MAPPWANGRAQADLAATVQAHEAVALARPGKRHLERLEVIRETGLQGLRRAAAGSGRIVEIELVPGDGGQQRTGLVLEAGAEGRAAVEPLRRAAFDVEGVAHAPLPAGERRRQVVDQVVDAIVVGRLEQRPHAHVAPRCDFELAAVLQADGLLTAQAQFANAGVAQAHPGAVVEQPGVVVADTVGGVETAFQAERGAPTAVQVLGAAQAPEVVGLPPTQHLLARAQARHARGGQPHVHHPIQLELVGSPGWRDGPENAGRTGRHGGHDEKTTHA